MSRYVHVGPWEYGSDFECRPFDPESRDPVPWSGAAIWMTARAAWKALVVERSWNRIWIPSYFCHDVSLAAREADAEIMIYPDDPREDRIRLPRVADEPGEALLVVNTFGRRLPADRPFEAEFCELIEDHTHDPLSDWARSSRADWCLASLRKTLPVPVGGVVWSPRGKRPPSAPEPTVLGRRTACDRLLGMTLKRRYLEGRPVPKSEFRRRLIATEARLAELAPSAAPSWAASLIERVPVHAWRRRRRFNLAFLAEALEDLAAFRLLAPADPSAAVLGAVALFEDAQVASDVESQLVRRDIYPARIWPLGTVKLAVPPDSIGLAARLLLIPCDGRYERPDLERVSQALRSAVRASS